MSINKAYLVIFVVPLLMSPSRLIGAEGADLNLETKTAVFIVKYHAMGVEKEAGTKGMTGVYHIYDTDLAYTFETRNIWMRFIDTHPEQANGEDDYASVGQDDELILMDYGTKGAYIHQSGPQENEFYHIRIITRNLAEGARGPGSEVFLVEFLKAKVPEVKSVYSENWNDNEEVIVREAFKKKLRSFCTEFNSELTAGLNN